MDTKMRYDKYSSNRDSPSLNEHSFYPLFFIYCRKAVRGRCPLFLPLFTTLFYQNGNVRIPPPDVFVFP